jgi:hypothetical protein
MKNKRKNIIKNIKKWYSNRNRLERTLIWSFTALFFISLFFNAGVQAWNGYHGLYLNQNECVDIGVSVALDNASNSYWEIVFIQLLPIIKWIAVAIGIAWILHGVQFRILA